MNNRVQLLFVAGLTNTHCPATSLDHHDLLKLLAHGEFCLRMTSEKLLAHGEFCFRMASQKLLAHGEFCLCTAPCVRLIEGWGIL